MARLICLNNGYSRLDSGSNVMQLVRDIRQTIDTRTKLARFNFSTLLLLAGIFLPGCGLVYDAITMVHPLSRDELSSICARERLRVGIAVEPFRPSFFPRSTPTKGFG